MTFNREATVYHTSCLKWLQEYNHPTDSYFQDWITEFYPAVPNKFWVCIEIRLRKKMSFSATKRELDCLQSEWRVQQSPFISSLEIYDSYPCWKRHTGIAFQRKRELEEISTKQLVKNSSFKK